MKTIIVSICFLAVLNGKAQQKVFTEEELIKVVRAYHPVAKQAVLDVRIAEAEVTSARSGFDPVFSVDNGRKLFDGTTYYNQRQMEVKIPTWYGIDLYAGKENITGSRLNPEDTKGTLNYVGFSAPVLQNLVMDKRRAALRQANIFRDLSEVQQKIVLNDLLQEAVRTYWKWWEYNNVNRLMEAALFNAEKRFLMVKAAYQLGDRPAIDTLEALTQIQSFRIKQNEAMTDLIKSRLQLSAFLWTGNEQQYDLPADVMPQNWSNENATALEAFLQAADTHPELLQYGFKMDALKIDRKLKFQYLLPEVNLKYNQIGYDLSKTINNPWFQNNYRSGISLSIPLRLSEGRGEYRKATLKLNKTLLEQTNKQVQVTNKIRQYYTEWQQTSAQASLQSSLVTNVIALQNGEETRFTNGESALFMINTRELRTIEAQQKLIEIQSKNRNALTDLRWSSGLFGNL